MQRLISALKIVDTALMEELHLTAHYIELNADTPLDGGLPENTWIFIEEGFVKKGITRRNTNTVDDFILEGSCLLLTAPSVDSPNAEGICISAIEPSKAYYFFPDEVARLCAKYPSFAWEHMAITMVAAERMRMISAVLRLSPEERLKFVKIRMPYLLRLPATELADYLQLTGKAHSDLLTLFN